MPPKSKATKKPIEVIDRAAEALGAKRQRASTCSAHPQAEVLLAKHKENPMAALWAALIDPSCGPEVAMAIVADLEFGLKQRSNAEDVNISDEMSEAQGNARRAMEGATPLILAAQAGRVDVVLALVEAGADVNEEVSDDVSRISCSNIHGGPTEFALQAAVRNDDVLLIEALLAKGADPLKPCRNSSDNLLFHCKSDAVTKILLGKGLDVKAKRWDGSTALHMMAIAQLPESISMLVEKGANVHAQDKSKHTPLHYYRGNEKSLRILIAKGADVNAINKIGQTILHTVVYNTGFCAEQIATVLSLGANVDIIDRSGFSPLHLATFRELPQSIYELLISDTNINISVKIAKGQTPLHSAIIFGELTPDANVNAVAALLNKGANMEATDAKGQTPLHAAASRCLPDIVEALVAKGASISALDKSGRTPLDAYTKIGKKNPWHTDAHGKRIRAALGGKV